MSADVAVTAPDYHADPAPQPSLSSSIAKILIDQSPAHAWVAHPRLNPEYVADRDPKYDIGTAAHKWLLEGEDICQVVDFPDFKTKAAREARDFAYEHDRIPLTPTQYWEVKAMVSSVAEQLQHLDVDPLPFRDGAPEVTLKWEEDGVWLRARLDWLRDDFLAIDDLKTTTRSANGRKWARGPLFDMGCEVQAAFYRRAVEAVHGVGMALRFRWVVVETKPPYALQVIEPGPDVLALGEAKVEKAISVWRRCMESGEWPAYPAGVYRAELPPWKEAEWVEREDVLA